MRHLSRAIDDYSVRQTEGVLEQTGFVAPRDAAPPAVAFVDLTGFTRLTEERGDREAASLAMRLGELTAETVRPHGGHVVKLLGDGVLVRFDDSTAAAEGVLALLETMPGAGLPTGHAGIASGPVVQRDGDVFGRTVNLAARLADAAPDGVLLVPATLAAGLPSGRFTTRSVGETDLHGVGRIELAAIGPRRAS
jgi:adenylate cyclase